jgi:phosphoenolpyruvate carboxykinase (diphosphate)
LASDWYRQRLRVCQAREVALWRRHIAALEAFARSGFSSSEVNVEARLSEARAQLAHRSTPAYLKELEGTIGADPFHAQVPEETGLSQI